MPSSPLDPAKVEEANDPESAFRKGLVEIDQLLDSGVGLSGHERNCGFLNVPAEGSMRRFATAGASLGLDQDDDSRSPVTVDWDADGDLDIWMANRTAPMVRFLRNELPGESHWIALHLQGTTCNRDAIGARVTVKFADGRQLAQTLKAGEGYLGQSSKWLHFGLGKTAEIISIDVHWPGGANESFSGLAANHRYHLIQGGKVETEPRRAVKRNKALAEGSSVPSNDAVVHAVSVSGWPLPQLPYRTFTGEEKLAGGRSKSFQLINLWATWCVPCLGELKAFGAEFESMKEANVELLALSVDKLAVGEAGGGQASRYPGVFFDELQLPFSGGEATEELIKRVEMAYARLFGPRWPLPVPTSVLLDPAGQVVAFYKGAVPVSRVLADVALSRLPAEAFHDGALPLKGRWFDRPEPLDPLIIALDLMERGQADAAMELAARAKARLRESVEFAKLLTWLGDELMKQQRVREALAHYREAVAEDDENTIVLNNLAWQLAAHEDLSVRNGAEAVRWAEKAAALTGREDPAVLDTLAAALAQNGEFRKAVATAETALRLARAQNKRALWEGIERGLQFYRAGRAYGVR